MRLLYRIVLFAALAFPLDGVAACHLNDWQQQAAQHGYQYVLVNLADSSCLGDSKADHDPLVARFNELTPDKGAAIARYEELIAAVKLLTDYADQHAAGPAQTKAWKALSRELQDITRLLAKAKDSTSKNALLDQVATALPPKWDISQSGTIELEGERFNLLASIPCNKADTACPDFASQRDMIREVNLVNRLRGYSQWNSLSEHYADAVLQTSRWDAYRSQGQHQYFWELWLNGRNMGEDLCPRDEKTGIQRGFCGVPSSQWIVLHPEAGLRWAKSAQSSSDLKPALLIELLGYNQWQWGGADKASMTSQYGASLVAAYTNEPSGKKWSYGPMIHFGKGYNLALTRSSGGTWGLVLNLNLADRFFGRKETVVNYLKCLNKPSIGSLIEERDLCSQAQ